MISPFLPPRRKMNVFLLTRSERPSAPLCACWTLWLQRVSVERRHAQSVSDSESGAWAIRFGVKLTWGGKRKGFRLFLCLSGDAEARSQKEQWDHHHRPTQACCCPDDSLGTSEDGHFLSPLFKSQQFPVIKQKTAARLRRPRLSH